MPRCPDCGFPYNVKRGSCLQCGRDLTLPPTEEEERQQRKVEAEQAEWERQRPPTRHGCLGSLIAMVVVVAGIVLLLPVAWLIAVGCCPGGPDGIEPVQSMVSLGQALCVVGLVGAAAAVGLVAIGVIAWRRYE